MIFITRCSESEFLAFLSCSKCFKRPSNSPAEVFTFIRGVNNKYPWLHFAIPCPIWAKLHSLPFPRISPNTTRLRLVVFGLILGNGNSCNFAKYPTLYIKNSPRLRLVEFLTYLVGYFKNTPRTNFKSPKYPSAAPRGIWEIWNWSSGYFFQIVPELHFARNMSNIIYLNTRNKVLTVGYPWVWFKNLLLNGLEPDQYIQIFYVLKGERTTSIISPPPLWG